MFIVLLITDIVLSFTMTIGGAVLGYKAPLDDSHSLGYKTARALVSAETWDFANRKCGRTWMIAGFLLLMCIPFCGPLWFLIGEKAGILAAAVILLLAVTVFIGAIVSTESALKRKFPTDQK